MSRSFAWSSRINYSKQTKWNLASKRYNTTCQAVSFSLICLVALVPYSCSIVCLQGDLPDFCCSNYWQMHLSVVTGCNDFCLLASVFLMWLFSAVTLFWCDSLLLWLSRETKSSCSLWPPQKFESWEASRHLIKEADKSLKIKSICCQSPRLASVIQCVVLRCLT